MSEIKQRALTKMNEEMSKPHIFAVDAIHNWLCVQEDDELFEGICKEGKTVANAYTYCVNKASDQRDGGCAVVADSVVFGWAAEYFKSDLKNVKAKATANVTVQNVIKDKEKKEEHKTTTRASQKEKAKEKSDFERISLFEI